MSFDFSSKFAIGSIVILIMATIATSLLENWNTDKGRTALTQEINQPSGFIYETLRKIDTDKDGLPDGWEENYFGSLELNPYQDYDGDGLSNGEECNPKFIFDEGQTFNYCISIYDKNFTDPRNPDTNQDGISDGDEFWGRTQTQIGDSPVMFSDVPETHRHFSSIDVFFNLGIIPPENTPANKFFPDKPISRIETIVFLVGFLDLDIPSDESITEAPFDDVNRLTLWSTPYLQSALNHNLISYIPPENIFRPDDNVTRSEFLEFIFTAFDLPTADPANITIQPFSDTALGWWDIPYIQVAKNTGLMPGFGDGRFFPQNPVTRAEATDLIIRASQLAVNKSLIMTDSPSGSGETVLESETKSTEIETTTGSTTIETTPEEPKITCPETYAPVCSTKNETFDNQCFLEEAKQTLLHVGICDSDRNDRVIRFTSPANYD